MIQAGLFADCFAPLSPPSDNLLNEGYEKIKRDWASETEFMDAHFSPELTRYGLLGLLITLSDLTQHSEQILPFLKTQKWSKSLSQFLIKALGVLKSPPKLEDDAYCEQLFLGLNVNTWPLLAYWQIQQTITAKQAQVAWLYCQATIELEASLPILMDGHAISQLTQIPSGPEIGEILVNLRKQQRSGVINTLEDAKAWLVQFHP
jgi:hypothetical protein